MYLPLYFMKITLLKMTFNLFRIKETNLMNII